MKKFTIVALLVSSQLQAQVAVNQHPDITSLFATDAVELSQINFNSEIKPTGGNQVWNFQGFTTLGFNDTAYYLSPSLFNTGKLAKGANLAIFDNNSPISALSYYSVDNSQQKFLGFSDDDSIYTELETPFLVNKFPLNYNDEFGDMSAFTIVSPFGSIKTEIESFSKVDSWGEIQTLLGKLPCLKVKSSTTLQGSLFGIPFFNATYNDYKWISPGYDYDIFRYSVGESEVNNEISNDTFAIILTDQLILRTTNLTKEKINIQVLPNPASDKIVINIPDLPSGKKVKVEIYDDKAAIIYSQEVTSQNTEINVSNWARGNYMISVRKDNLAWGLQKLILN